MTDTPKKPREAAGEPARKLGTVVDGPLPPRRKSLGIARLLSSAVAGMLTREAPPAGVDPSERSQPQVGGRGTRDLAVTPESYNSAARTVDAVLSAGTAVRRYYFTEELEISEEAIDLTRVNAGICPLLDTHNQYELNAVIGRISNVRIEEGRLIGTLTFSDTEAGRAVEARVASGELRAISIGYRVTRWQITATDENDYETWRAVAWELLEASLVPVPADPNAVVRSAQGFPAHGVEKEEDMRRNLPGGGVAHPNANQGAAPAAPAATIEAPARSSDGSFGGQPSAAPTPPAAPEVRAPAIPASRILELCGRTEELGSQFAGELIRDSEAGTLTETSMMSRISERLITARSQPSIDARAGRSGTEDAGYRQAVEDALLLTANPGERAENFGITAERVEAAREFRSMSLREMARNYLDRTGIRSAGLSPNEIAGQALGFRGGALTTSDFANALGNAANRRVRRAFEAAPQSFRPFVSTGTLPDFRPASIIGMGDAPALLLVKENGEIKHGALTDTGDTYKLATYARIIPISRQAIINDDKNLFGRIPLQFANKAADLESDLVYSQLTGNPTMYDGVALFHTSHGNLAGAGTAITVASVGAGRAAMLQQKSAEGGNLSIRPQFLIVGPLQETAAEQFLTAVTAGQASAVNPFPGKLTLVVDARITDYSWYLAASPNAFDTIELAHLEGQEALFTDTHLSFEVDGIKFKARLDATAKALDYRGLYKNPGAAPA